MMDSCVYNSLLTATVKDRSKRTTSVFMFQCEDLRVRRLLFIPDLVTSLYYDHYVTLMFQNGFKWMLVIHFRPISLNGT